MWITVIRIALIVLAATAEILQEMGKGKRR